MADNIRHVWIKPSDSPCYPGGYLPNSPSPNGPKDPLSDAEVNKWRQREESKARRNLFGTSGKLI